MSKITDNSRPVLVTTPHMPPLEEYLPYLQEIWGKKWVTNKGPFHEQLESELSEFLGVEHLSLFCNGTIALITALQALEIEGDVITTPYSFVATAHALLWNGLQPVFADIDSATMNLDPAKIEAAITPRTTAIMPVHCYGRPCDMDAIEDVARRHGLKVLYDAAHAFHVRQNGHSVLNSGDMSILSFHATKVFNTFEGGAVISPNAETKARIDQLKNFGFVNETTVVAAGINGKMNELQAAFGLLQLKNIDDAIAARSRVAATYRKMLESVPGITLPPPGDHTSNFAYFPILVTPDYPETRDALYERLKQNGVFGRRYFYPLISSMPMYCDLPSAAPDNLPVAEEIAQQVICLPIHTDMDTETAAMVADLIRSA